MSSAKRPRRFSHQVFMVFTLSLLPALALFTGSFLYSQRQRLEADLQERGRMLAGLLASGAKTAVYSENPTLVQDTLQGVLEHREVFSAAVFTRERAPLTAAAKSAALRERALTLTAAERALLDGAPTLAGCASLNESGHVDVFCPVVIGTPAASGEELYFGSPPAASREEIVGFVRLSLDRGPLRRALAALLLRSLLLAATLLLVGTATAFLLSRRVAGPLEQLTEAVHRFGAGERVGPLPRASEDEIGRLSEAFTGMIRDLGDRAREQAALEERLRKARTMEAVGTLTQGLSHDFKNILSTIKAAVHILRKGAADNPFVVQYADRIQGSANRAHALIERLVAFSRTGGTQVRPLNLAALLCGARSTLAEALGDGSRLELETPDGEVIVAADAASLEQLLANLAYNARDAMPRGGVLSIRLEALPAPDGGTARLSVRDTGSGMDARVQRRIFEPFFTTKEVGAGIGLGLSIVHGIVEQHRGRIEVESEQGVGTLFRIDLPLVGAGEPESGGAPAAAGGVQE